MEIVVAKPQRQSKPKKPVVVISNNNNKNNAPKKKKGSAVRQQKRAGNFGLDKHIYAGLMFPDIYGPIRVPMPGDVSKTALGMDRTVLYYYKGATTADTVTLVRPWTLYNGSTAGEYQATSTSAAFTLLGNTAAGQRWPPVAAVSSCRLTGFCITVQYTGKIVDCAGSLLLGTLPDQGNLPPDPTTTTWNKLSYLPEVVQIPVAKALEEPIRISGFHTSPDSWGYFAPGSTPVDFNYPFIAVTGMTAGSTLTFEVTRTWEIRTNFGTSGDSIPFESSASGRAADEAVMTNTLDMISHLATTVSEALPNILMPVVNSVKSGLPEVLASTARTYLDYSVKGMFRDLAASGGRTHRLGN